jgi:6-pyruvoyltetrahydropterin/6-carboxytetrahydropterin synthase
LVFATDELDVRGWAVDFGSLKSFKGILEDLFDHTTIIAEDDPNLKDFKYLDMCDLIKLRVLPRSSCECLAEYLYEVLDIWLKDNGYKPRIWIHSVEVQEHDANSAIFIPDEIYKDPRDL